jgi:hypothetical protein
MTMDSKLFYHLIENISGMDTTDLNCSVVSICISATHCTNSGDMTKQRCAGNEL